jgi:hypothetical protein
VKINGLILTDAFANPAFSFFKVKAVFMNIGNKGNGLREIYMDGFICRQVLIVWIRDLDRAVLDASAATRAVVLDNVSGLFAQGDIKVSCLPFDALNFSIG